MTKKMLKVSQEMRNNFMGFHQEINKFINGFASNLGSMDETITYHGSLALTSRPADPDRRDEQILEQELALRNHSRQSAPGPLA